MDTPVRSDLTALPDGSWRFRRLPGDHDTRDAYDCFDGCSLQFFPQSISGKCKNEWNSCECMMELEKQFLEHAIAFKPTQSLSILYHHSLIFFQIRQLSQATAPATTDSMQQRPLIVPGGTNGRGGVKDDTLEGTSNYSSEEELEPNGGYGDCDSTTRGRGPAVGSGETSERTTSLPASPTSSRHSSCSQVPSRSSSPAVSIRSPGSTSPMSRPGSPMSQGSGCGSMAPMYSPVSLTEADLLLNAASTDGVDCEFDQQNAGGVSASANTDANAGADSDADAGADACGGEKEGTAAMIDASCRIQGVRDSRGIVVHEGGELMVTVSEAIEARSGGNLNLANGDVGDVKKPSSPAASPRHARWAATGAPDGGNGKTGAISDMHKADAKQQPLESCSASKRRGEGRSRSRSPRRRKKPAVDNSGGKEGVGNHVLASKTTSSRNDNNDNNVSISSPCSERGHQRDPTGTEHGSPREPRRRRRRGKGKCHSLRNHDSINNDRKMDPEPRAGSHAASKGETTGAGAVCALDGGAGDTGAWEDRGARPHSSEAPGETEKGTGPDPMEAGHMLQALSDLSTTLRRLNKDPLSPALHDTTSTADRGGEGGVREANAVSSAPCERCLLLAEKVEDLREHTRAQQRLLEHSDKLLGVTTAATAKKHDARRSSAGQEVNSEVDLPVTAYVDDNAERAAACNAVVMHEENGGSRRGVRRPGRVGPQDTREGAGRDMGSGTSVAASEAEVAEAAVAEAAAAEAAAAVADEENEALLAAAEEVWRISEMARDALEVELERKEEAVSKVAETARESKERLAEQVLISLGHTPLSPRRHRRRTHSFCRWDNTLGTHKSLEEPSFILAERRHGLSKARKSRRDYIGQQACDNVCSKLVSNASAGRAQTVIHRPD